DGELVWVRLSWLKSFVKQVLPLVKSRFVLATADSDACVPSEVMPEAQAILNAENVAHWYAQNYDGSMAPEKISPLPIGIAFHMQSEGPFWGESASPPKQQERTLRSIHGNLPPLRNRIQKVYVDFAWQQGFGLRDYRRYHPLTGTKFHESKMQVVKTMLKNDIDFCQRELLCRSEMWRKRGAYAFVLSPWNGTRLSQDLGGARSWTYRHCAFLFPRSPLQRSASCGSKRLERIDSRKIGEMDFSPRRE